MHGKILGDVRLKMGGTDVWAISVELADEQTVCGVSCCSKDKPKDLKTVDKSCCLVVPAFVM